MTRKGIGFLAKTALGPGMGAVMVATYISKMLRDREIAKNIPEWKVKNLERGIEAIRNLGEPESKQLSRWQGRENILAARMEQGSLSPKAFESAARAEQLGDLINKSEKFARDSKLDIPYDLERLRDRITLADARGQALGLQPLTRQGLEAFITSGLQSAFNDDPALKKMGEAGSQWITLPLKVAEMALGKLNVIQLGLSLMR
jgi:hypothetical protein